MPNWGSAVRYLSFYLKFLKKMNRTFFIKNSLLLPEASSGFRLRLHLLLPLLLPLQLLHANVSLPAIFTGNMVLQQNAEVRLWGWGKPLEKITVTTSWSNDTLRTVADNQANWEVKLPTPKAGGPYEITIQGYNQRKLSNVLTGEVWLCSGQSNMEWTAGMGIDNGEEEIKNANYPDIRFIKIGYRTAATPQVDAFSDGWEVCTPESMSNHSAVAYFFARKLQAELGVPIGLIDDNWGGTAAESWVPGKVFEADVMLAEAAKLLKNEPWATDQPGIIYHAMVAPLTHFNIAGVIWYQGETNTANPLTYKELFSTLIKTWRSEWGYEFPFYFAQIAPWKGYGAGGSGALVRDAQRRTLEVPNTGMVVTSDIGNLDNIHPKNKQDVGLRMANLALKNYYKTTDVEASGPLYRSFEIEKNKIRIFFDHADGLQGRGGALTHFEIAGEDQVFQPAEAVIEGSTVVVSSKNVKLPVTVRFAMSNTAEPNLFNGAGLPGSCFTTGFSR